MKAIHFQIDGIEHEFTFQGSKISIDNGEYYKLKTFPKCKESSETRYTIPVGEDTVYLYRFVEGNVVQNGIDLVTGEFYEPVKISICVWILCILSEINFLLYVGNTPIAGLIYAIAAVVIAAFSVKKKRIGIGLKIILGILTILILIGVWLVLSALIFLIFAMLFKLIGNGDSLFA